LTIVLEAAIAAGLCVLPKRQHSAESYFVTSTSRGSYQISSGTTIEDELVYRFSSLPGVSGVAVLAEGGDSFSVSINLLKFDRETRRSMYALGRDLHEEFPNCIFDFRLIDRSQAVTEDAHTV
jgi:hypothetical protein